MTLYLMYLRTKASYLQNLRAVVRGLWTGVTDEFETAASFEASIRRGLTQAWHEGIGELGLTPADMSEDEQRALRARIARETSYIDGFIDAIMAGSKENGGALAPLLQRAAMWAERWEEVKAEALMMVQQDPPLEWHLNPLKENCSSCAKLNGKVKRASYWNQSGVLPGVAGAGYLECQGYRCGCELLPTDKPLSKGPLPRLP
jgi:hypothetical protein